MATVIMTTSVVEGGLARPIHLSVTVSDDTVEEGVPLRSFDGLDYARADLVMDTVREAVRNSLFRYPRSDVDVKLSEELPATADYDLDLPIALGILAGSGQLTDDMVAKIENSVVAGCFAPEGTVNTYAGGARGNTGFISALESVSAESGLPAIGPEQVPTLTDIALARDFAAPPTVPGGQRGEKAEEGPDTPALEEEAEVRGQSPEKAEEEPALETEEESRIAELERELSDLKEQLALLDARNSNLESENAELTEELERSRAEEMRSEALLAERNAEIESLQEKLSAAAQQPAQAIDAPPVTIGDFEYRPTVDVDAIGRAYVYESPDGSLMNIRPAGAEGAQGWDWQLQAGGTITSGRAETLSDAVAAIRDRHGAYRGTRRAEVPSAKRETPRLSVTEDAGKATVSSKAARTLSVSKGMNNPVKQ